MATRSQGVPPTAGSGQPQAGEVMLVNLAALAIAGFVSFSLIIWDFISYIPPEIRLLKDFRRVKLWRMPDPWAFILSRYSAFSFAVASLFVLSLKTQNCQTAAAMTQVFSIGVVATSGVLVARRTIALWMNDSAVATLLGTMYALMIASWVATATQLRAQSSAGPLSKFGTNCLLQKLPPWSPINYAASTVFFTLTLLLSTYRMASQRTDRSLNVGLTPINRGCIWYFLVNALTSLALFIVSVDWHPNWMTEIAERSARPFFIVLVAAMNHRIYLNNQVDHAVRQKGLEEKMKSTYPANMANARPRWSFAPIRRKPAPSAAGDIPPVVQHYPRPPPPPPSVPISPIPPQHIASLQRSRKTSYTSSASSSSSEIVFQSPPASTSTQPKAPGHGRGDSSTTNASMSPNTSGVSSPTSAVSTIAFGSPPGSPAVLSLPALGKQQRRAARDVGRESFGSVMTGSGHGSHPGTPYRGLKRLSSFKSGWVI